MTIADLIKELQKLDPKMEVMLFDGTGLWLPVSKDDKNHPDRSRPLRARLAIYQARRYLNSSYWTTDSADPGPAKKILGIG